MISRHPNSGQNWTIRIANESFEHVAIFKYFGATLTNQNDIHDEIKSRLNSGNDFYHSVQNLLSSRLFLLALAPQPLVRHWTPPKSSSIYPSPTPTQMVVPGSSIRSNFLEASQHFVFTG
jgi:hypothetical protein